MRGRFWYGVVAGAVLGVLAFGTSPARANSRSQALYARGLVPFHNGRWDDAYKLFDEAVKADPEDALAVYYRGLTAARRGESKQAIPDLERAAQSRPGLGHVTLDLGVAYFDTGQYPQAQQWLEKAHATAADRFPAAFFLGLTHYRQGDFAKAQPYFQEAETDPELRPTAHYYAGLVLLRQGHEAEGRAALEQAAQGRADTEAARAAQSYLAGGGVQQPPAPGAREAKPWAIYGDLAFQYDSNVTLSPSDSAVSGTSTGQDDGRTVLGVGGRYHLLQNDSSRITASYDFSQSLHFQLHEFDLQGHRVRLEGVTDQGPVQLGLATTYDAYFLNYQSFFQEVLVTPWVTLPEGEAASTQLYYTFRGRDFFRGPYDPARDSTNNAFGVRQYALLGSADRLFSIGYQFDAEDTVPNHVKGHPDEFQYKGNQFDARLEFPLAEIATAELSYLFRLEDYQFPTEFSTPAYTLRRHDNQHEFVVALYHDLNDYLQLTLAYLGVLNNSNIPTFDYDRNIVSVGLRAHF